MNHTLCSSLSLKKKYDYSDLFPRRKQRVEEFDKSHHVDDTISPSSEEQKRGNCKSNPVSLITVE